MDFNPKMFTPEPARGTWWQRRKLWEPFVCEAKLDGARQVLANINGTVTMTGRRDSKVTGEKLDKVTSVPHLERFMALLPNTVLDGELYMPGGQSNEVVSIIGSKPEKAVAKQAQRQMLHFVAFDILFQNGHDLRGQTYNFRRNQLLYVLKQYPSPFVYPVRMFDEDKLPDETPDEYVQRMFFCATQEGFEGLILKTQSGTYNHLEWAKVKGEHTYDMIICGYDESDSETFAGNGIAALQLGLYVSEKNLRMVTKCSGMTHWWRQQFYKYPDEYMGQVVEVKAQEMFETGALRHPRFVRLRPEVNAEDQTFAKYNIQE